MRIFLLFLVAGAGTAAIGNQIGDNLTVLAGVVLVALTLWVGWRRRPHALGSDGRWTCKNGHASPGGSRRCRMPGCGSLR